MFLFHLDWIIFFLKEQKYAKIGEKDIEIHSQVIINYSYTDNQSTYTAEIKKYTSFMLRETISYWQWVPDFYEVVLLGLYIFIQA